MTQYPEITIDIPDGKYVYFASDFHLGNMNVDSSIAREKNIIRWLSTIEEDAAAIFLVGDVFDFWFEYRHSIPKGCTRLLGKLAELSDAGIPIHVFTGNHDIWMFGYFEEELKIPVYHEPRVLNIGAKKFFVGHGDGLGPGDKKFKWMKKVFTTPFFQWCFRWLHPDIGIKIASIWSERSRTNPADERYMGDAREWLVQYAKRRLEETHFDVFVFGHRHLPIKKDLNEKSIYFNLGDWIVNNTYLKFNGHEANLEHFTGS